MYRAVFYFAFLAFCSSAPYGDFNSARTLPIRQDQFVQPQLSAVSVQQQDDSELVDTLGAGYAFFKKQPIGARPLAQQKLAINEQQVPITSLDDTSNQWSDYTRASAFKQQTVQKQGLSASNDLLLDGGYGQQKAAPRSNIDITQLTTQDRFPQFTENTFGNEQRLPVFPTQVRTSVASGYGSQQQDTNLRVDLAPKTLVSQDQSSYGTFGQNQQQDLQPVFQQPQQQQLQIARPINRNFDNAYGQQQLDQSDLVTVKSNGGYGQQVQPDFSDFSKQIQQKVVLPQIKTLDSGYGQQQQLDQSGPWAVNSNGGYGQQVQPGFSDFSKQTQQKIVLPQIKTLDSGYGQRQQDQVVIRPINRNFDSGYGQQRQLDQSGPWAIKSNGGYGQQVQPDFSDFSKQTQQKIVLPQIKTLDSGYGQQQQDQVVIRPINRNFDSGYGQQQQEISTDELRQPSLQQINLGRSNSALLSPQVPIQRFIPKSQPATQSDSGSFGGW